MNNQFKLEHLKGKYAILVALIAFLGIALTIIFSSKKGSSKVNNQNNKIQTNQNSPVANEIQTQNNYYANSPNLSDSLLRNRKSKDSVKPVANKTVEGHSSTLLTTPKEKIVYKKDSPTEKVNDKAQTALIITNNQNGGSNTVNVQQIPSPKIKLENVEINNDTVKEILPRHGPRREKITLPSTNYNYESLYRTRFTISYTCPVNLNAIGFWIKREDVVYLDVVHSGKMMSQTAKYRQTQQPIFIVDQPENGFYTFDVYTINKFGNPMQEFEYLKD